jgi:hypothetical protein
MKAMVIRSTATATVLEQAETPEREPGPGVVLELPASG